VEPISAIVMSLALGAGAIAGKEMINAIVKDAYGALKGLVKSRYPNVSVDQLEQAPESKNRRAVVEEDLTTCGAAQDRELLAAAHNFLGLIQSHVPGAAAAIGVDLKDVSTANLHLADIVASGTGVKLERVSSTGDIDIRGVHAGILPNDLTKD
jgi:hypothetical protein